MESHGQADLREGLGNNGAPEAGTWHPRARRVPSPNQDARPAGMRPSLLVIHGISLPPGEFGGPWIDALFTNRLDPTAHPYFREIAHLRVSAHLLIDRRGHLTQYVPFERRAWHAGRSRFGAHEGCNDFSIGIELEGTDEVPYTDEQYGCLAEVTRWLMARYPDIVPERIVGHSDIAPGRKTDPGPAFDWVRYRALLENGT
ncbi:MAG: 1,6-anhydro-N-acetylmuramyl-L-alanine amidase AmpD [Gammaproteobacteria bacterium]|nr:MAG: 1,6-anhydro-N-acetylmuramyl-L-alanine amidase AmpD [Gammaproteobacteria bacterium]